MLMPYPRRPMLAELINRLLHPIAFPLNQIRTNEKPRPVEPVMAMHTDQRILEARFRRRGAQAIDDLDEVSCLLWGGRDL